MAAFLVLARLEHVTRAATRLGISQPTLSRRLARLEREVGVRLFEREGKRLRLNRYGRIFAQRCRRSLEELAEGRQRISELVDPGRGEIHLAYLAWLGSWLVPDLLKAFRQQAPDARFMLRAGSAKEIAGQLHRGLADCILTTRRPGGDQVRWAPLRREALYLAVPIRHPLAGRQDVALVEARDEGFIMPSADMGLREFLERLCENAGFAPRIILESHELSTIRGLVEAGLGVAILHNDHRSGHPEPVYLALSDPGAWRDIGIAWLEDAPPAPLVARFRHSVLASAAP